MKQNKWILTGIIAIWLVGIGEFFIDAWLASHYPGYDWTRQSISYLGQAGSPVAVGVAIWGVFFTCFFLLFAMGFFKAFGHVNRWAILASLMIAVYGLGEGIGSGFFPINPPGTPFTTAAFLHDLFGGIGDTAMVLLPLVLMFKVFPRREHPSFFYYSVLVIVVGLSLAASFLAAKSLQPQTGLLIYKGLWQRLYILNYNLYFLVLSWKMWKNS